MAVGFQKFYFSGDALSLQKSFLASLQSSVGNLQPSHVLVPNYYVAAHLRHLLAQEKALLNLRFVTIKDLAKSILRGNDEFLSKIRMTPEMELHQIGQIAEKILAKTEREIISNKRGFHQNLRKLFHHLIVHGGQKLPAINDKVKSFDHIFQKYLELKKKFYNDPWLIEAAAKQTAKDVFKLYIFGFTQFSPLEMRFLNQLAQSAEANLWMERGFFEDLQEAIFTWAGEAFKSAEELSASSTPKVTVQPASHLQDEVAWIAQTIVAKQKEKPVPFHRIGIFLNDFRKQKSYVEQAFQKFNIPYVFHGGRSLTSTFIGRSLEILTEVLFQNWKRDAWIRFLQTFPFKQSTYDTCGTPDQWNQWTIDAQITDKNTFFIQRLENQYRINNNSKLKSFIELQKDLVSSLDLVEKTFSRNIPTFIQKWFQWIQTYADPTQIRDEHAMFFDDLIYFSNALSSGILWQEFKSVIQDKLQSPVIQDQVFESDGVFVAPVSTVPGLNFDHIFLPYVNEGAFPKTAGQDFDLTSHEMFLITQKSGIAFKNAEFDFEMQKVLFETTKTRTQQLFVSYSQCALPNQEELRPSVFLHGLPKEKIFSAPLDVSSDAVDSQFTQSIKKYYESIYNNTWSNYNALISEPVKKPVYSARDVTTYLTCPRQYYLSQVLRVSVDEFPENRFQVDPKDKGTLVHDILFKIFSRLKKENLFPLESKNENKIMDVAKSVANEAFDRFVMNHAYGSEEMWKIDREELSNDIVQYMKHEIREGKYWIPYALEYRFGMQARGGEEDPLSTEKPVTLPVLDKQLAFRGKVDRIDVSPDKQQMRIVDYKTGAFRHVNWNYEKGTNLQIPLYMMLSKHFFPELQPERIEGALVHVKSFSKFDRRVLPHESLSNAESKILELLDLADTGIQQGKFYPNPGNNRSNCRLCDFQPFCGENIDRDIESIPVDEFMDQYQSRKDALK